MLAGGLQRLYAALSPDLQMSNSSTRGSGLSGESPLDRRLCAELGAELARVRVAKGLSIAHISEKLLLSPRQVKALEEVEFSAFHNATFHVNAMRKYAAFAGLDPARVTTIAAAIVPTGPPVLPVTPDAADEADRQGMSLATALVALVLMAGAGGYYLWSRQPAPSPTTASTPVAVSTPPPPPVAPPAVVDGAAVAALSGSEAMAVSNDTPAASASTTAAAPVASPSAPPVATVAPTVPPVEPGFGMVRVLHPTWVYIRDADNVVIEKSLGEGQTIALDTQPTYLAVGTPDVQLTIGGKRIELARFVTNGQVRIRAGDFDALAQGVTPITAPTAVR